MGEWGEKLKDENVDSFTNMQEWGGGDGDVSGPSPQGGIQN